MEYRATDGTGKELDPMAGTVPIIKEKEKGKLQVIGTGFYITRYGLVMTANHVMWDLASGDKKTLVPCFVCHPLDGKNINLRKFLSVSLLEPVDLAVGQVDNYCEKFPDNPLMNHRVPLSSLIPQEGADLVTYAYPENEIMDFSDPDSSRIIKGNFYKGKLKRYVRNSEHPFIHYPHYETTINIKSGASGGPVFYNGRVIGVNCRGWDFGKNISEDENLSYVVPVVEIFPLKIRACPKVV